MFELQGRYGTAKVFTDDADEKAIHQVIDLLNQPYAAGSKIRMMPDIHAGAGCTIGTTMTITDKVCPNLVGVDIGCGMEVAILDKDIDPEEIDNVVRNYIPAGFAIHEKEHDFAKLLDFNELRCKGNVDIERAKRSIGTLGGGNHFIEVDEDENGVTYLVVHSGSRHLGVEIANYYQKAGYDRLRAVPREEIKKTVSQLKQAGRCGDIEKAIEEMKKARQKVPKDLAYLHGDLMDDYLNDMKFAQKFAKMNRGAILSEILYHLDTEPVDRFETVHNYIDLESGILRKGAVSAKHGERLIIPMNMRDGSLICVGKGNEDWNCSAPHGAGRLFSRSEAKERFTVDEFKRQMDGIYSTSIGQSTLDECPMAYKSMQSILDNIGPTVDVTNVISPLYNFKAGD